MKKTVLILMAAAISFAGAAQSLDSKVVVTNEYKAGEPEGVRQTIEMAVPDSLHSFDYKFDYSVFDSRYNGSYEFSPYTIKLNPEKYVADDGNFFLKAGLGYSLHPDFELLWRPVDLNKFTLDVSALASGYVGSYNAPAYCPDRSGLSGHDLSTAAGVKGNFRSRSLKAGFNFNYRGSFASGRGLSSAYNTAALGAFLESGRESGTFFYYKAALSFLGGSDNATGGKVNCGNLNVDGSIGAVIKSRYRLLVDMNVGTDNNSLRSLYLVCARPKLQFDLGGVRLKAGVSLESATDRPFSVFPDVYASYDFLGGKIGVFASFCGGDRLGTYDYCKSLNHHFLPGRNTAVLTAYRTNDLNGGVRGGIGESFEYKVSVGVASNSDSPLESVASAQGGFERFYLCDYMNTYADAMLRWSSRRLDADFELRCNKSFVDAGGVHIDGGLPDVFKLPSVSGRGYLSYNFRRRIFLALDAEFQSSRKSSGSIAAQMPSWLDLGASAHYRTPGNWGFYLRGGNLLNNTICHSQLYFEKGVNVTLGITYSF